MRVLVGALISQDWVWPKHRVIDTAVLEVDDQLFNVVRRRQRVFELAKAEDSAIAEIKYWEHSETRLIWIVHNYTGNLLTESPRVLAANEQIPERTRVKVFWPLMQVTEDGISWEGMPLKEDDRPVTGCRAFTDLLTWAKLIVLEGKLTTTRN